MRGNMRSLVAQAYRVRQRRSFSSSAPNPIDHKVKELDIPQLLDSATTCAIWFAAGSGIHFCWEMSRIFEIEKKSDIDKERYKIEMKRFLDELGDDSEE